MEGGNANSNMMMENNGIIYPMIMVPPFTTSDYHNNNNNKQNNNNNNNNNTTGGSATTNQHHNNQFCCSSSSSSSLVAAHQNPSNSSSHYNLIMEVEGNHHQQHSANTENGTSIKSKIMSHPHYSRLLSAYLNCQKVGAPPEVVARLEEAEAIMAAHGGGRGVGGGGGGFIGEDPALDQFMEAYCEMLTKYEQELTKPFKEAMLFLSRIESQFKALTLSSSSHHSTSAYGEGADRNGSSEEDIDINNNFIDPTVEDRELKGQLLRKYSGYLGSLRQEFLKKRKKGKLPKEARQQLLDWWSRHYKWPYPSESQKLALAESTGLDQKQINNWFINQRKRHWKPSEDMQFVVMDAAAAHAHVHAHPHPHPHYNYMDNILGNPFSMDVSPTLM